jgi:hypothetical protein
MTSQCPQCGSQHVSLSEQCSSEHGRQSLYRLTCLTCGYRLTKTCRITTRPNGYTRSEQYAETASGPCGSTSTSRSRTSAYAFTHAVKTPR